MQDPFRRHLVLWLVGREASLAELTELAGKPMSTMFSMVRQLERLGLVKVASKLARKGRAIKRYTATAKAYFVPIEIGRDLAGPAIEEEFRTSLEVLGPLLEGTLYYRDDSGDMRIKPIHEDAPNETVDEWRIITLTAGQLREIAGKIGELLSQIEDAQGGGRKYLVRFAAAPKAPDPFFLV